MVREETLTPIIRLAGITVVLCSVWFTIYWFKPVTTPPALIVEEFETDWREMAKPLALMVADLEHRLLMEEAQEPVGVKTETVKVEPKEKVAEVPEVFPRHHVPKSDLCTRHGMHKVITHGGKSWRCRK